MTEIRPLLQLENRKIVTERLSQDHAMDYVEAQVQRLVPVPLLPRISARLFGPMLVRMPRVRGSIPGHSLLGVYRKPTDE